MDKILLIAGNQIRKELSKKSFIITMIISPLVLTFLIGLATGGTGKNVTMEKIPYYVVNKDGANIASDLIKDLQKSTGFEPVENDEASAFKVMDDRKVIAVLEIPQGFGEKFIGNEPIPLEFFSLDGPSETVAIKQDILNFVTQLRAATSAGKVASAMLTDQQKNTEDLWNEAYSRNRTEWVTGAPVRVIEKDEQQITPQRMGGFNQSSLGFTVMFVMFTIVLAAGGILEERELNTWSRMLISPTKPSEIVGGFFLGACFIGYVQNLVLILAGKFLFGVNWGASILGVFALMTAYILAVMGIGSFLAGMVRTKQQLQGFSFIIIITTCMLGGVYWPIDIVSPGMQLAAKFTPQGWVMAGLTDLIFRGKDVSSIYIPSLILVIMAIIFFAATVVKIKWDSSKPIVFGIRSRSKAYDGK